MFGKGKPENTGFGELQAKLNSWSIPADALDAIREGRHR
jgi:hypothetical protein